MVTTFGVVLALVACGTVAWFTLRPEPVPPPEPSPHPSTTAPSPSAAAPRTRGADATPVTRAELFGTEALRDSYTLLGSQALRDCAAAATDALAVELAAADCTQVVRATVTDAERVHTATMGVANLPDARTASDLREAIESDEAGGFTPLSGTGGNRTVLGFNTYGHYLLYVVIGRSDGRLPSAENETTRRMVHDLVDSYLVDRLESRGTD